MIPMSAMSKTLETNYAAGDPKQFGAQGIRYHMALHWLPLTSFAKGNQDILYEGRHMERQERDMKGDRKRYERRKKRKVRPREGGHSISILMKENA